MNGQVRWAVCTALLGISAVAAAEAPLGCDSVNFGAEVLVAFPKIRSACHGLTTDGGHVYAHFVGEVVAVDDTTVTVHFKDRNDRDISEIRIATAQDELISADGNDVAFADLERGMRLDFWVPHDKWGLYASPRSQAMTVLSRKEL